MGPWLSERLGKLVIIENRPSVLLTALDRRPAGLRQPDWTLIASHRQRPKQSIDCLGVSGDLPVEDLADH